MKVFVNAISIREGGPLTVISRLLPEMKRLRPDAEWVLALNASADDAIAGSADIVIRADIDRTPLHLITWYEISLPAALRRTEADVLYSVTNYLPRRPLPCPTLLLEQHAGHFSSLFEALLNEANPSLLSRALWRQKNKWVRKSVQCADTLTVQSAALADAITESGERARKDILVVPHGPGWVEHHHAALERGASSPFRIGFVSKWGVQKNFETLFRAVRRLANEGAVVRLVLTLDQDQKTTHKTLARADEIGISDLIENHGEISPSEIAALYDTLDAYAFPSLCESFGMTMVEAMARAIPIVVAGTDVNREVAGAAALVFEPYDDAALAEALRSLIQDRALWLSRSELSRNRGAAFSWTKVASDTLSALEQLCAKPAGAA